MSGIRNLADNVSSISSNVQSQIDLKAPLANPTLTSPVTIDGNNISPFTGFKNYIINGNFDVWQRGTSFLTLGAYGGYTADRFCIADATGCQKYVDASEGNTLYYPSAKVTANCVLFLYPVELNTYGNNSQFSVGKTFTLSIRYKSTSKIKPYIVFRNGVVGIENTATSQVFGYKGGSGSYENVSWTFTITGTCGVSDNSLSIAIFEETQANVYIANIQLEEGSVATPFEQRPYGLELSLCQRYYEKFDYRLSTMSVNNGRCHSTYRYSAQKRTTPSFSYTDGVGNVLRYTSSTANNVSFSAGGLAPFIEYFYIDAICPAANDNVLIYNLYFSAEL